MKRGNIFFAVFVLFLIPALLIAATIYVVSRSSGDFKVEEEVFSTPTPKSTLSPVFLDKDILPGSSPTLTPKSKTYPFGKSFSLPIKGADGEILGTADYLVKEYEYTNKLMVNHVYDALLKDNRNLLVFHIEITNDTSLAFSVYVGDHIRLIKGDNRKLLAPDIEEDPVEVRPNSTVETKVGFIFDNDNDDLVIRLGEQDGEYQEIIVPRNE